MADTETHAQIIQQLVQSDSQIECQLGYLLKYIYHESETRPEAFIKSLDRFIGRKEQEIERITQKYYKELVSSVDQLLKIKKDAKRLEGRLRTLYAELQSSGQGAMLKKLENVTNKRLAMNIKYTIGLFCECSGLLALVQQIIDEMERDTQPDYYRVLKCLSLIQNEHLRKGPDYQFVHIIQAWVPSVYMNIEESVMLEVRAWLAKIREWSPVIGRIAMAQIESQPVVEHRASAFLSSDLMFLQEKDHFSAVSNQEIQVDFAPLLNALHIYTKMDRRHDFQLNYSENRKLQAEILLQANKSILLRDFSVFENYIREIAGFFMVEFHATHLPHSFYEAIQSAVLWEQAEANLKSILIDGLHDLNLGASQLRQMKRLLVLFIQTMSYYGYCFASLKDILVALFYRFVEIQRDELHERLTDLIRSDDLSSRVTVRSAADYHRWTDKFSFLARRVEESDFPFSLSCSSFLFPAYDALIGFVESLLEFAELPLESNELFETIKKNLDTAIVEGIGKPLMAAAKSKSSPKLVQLSLNLGAIAHCCQHELVLYLKQKRPRAQVCLKSLDELLGLKKRVEFQILGTVRDRIEDIFAGFIPLYNWAEKEAGQQPGTCVSLFLQEMADYLNTLWNDYLEPLAPSLKSHICYDVFSHVAARLAEAVLAPSVKSLGSGWIERFHQDVVFLESFASGLGDANLSDCFLELRQMVELLRTDRPLQYLEKSIRHKQYSKLSHSNVMRLLEKILSGASASMANRGDFEQLLQVLRAKKAAP